MRRGKTFHTGPINKYIGLYILHEQLNASYVHMLSEQVHIESNDEMARLMGTFKS